MLSPGTITWVVCRVETNCISEDHTVHSHRCFSRGFYVKSLQTNPDGQHGLRLNRLYCLSMEIRDLDGLGAFSSVLLRSKSYSSGPLVQSKSSISIDEQYNLYYLDGLGALSSVFSTLRPATAQGPSCRLNRVFPLTRSITYNYIEFTIHC